MATPTDVFAVPQALAEDVMRAYAERGTLKRLAQAGARAGSGGRSFAPHIEGLVEADDGQRWGVVDGLVIEQGPNYALAKRLQQWRAIVARADGHVASINVAPSTSTASVLSNPALAAGFRGAKAFDIEVFAPDTTNALMAALWVHDLRNPQSAAQPAVPLAHPLQLLVQGANHGGLWRVPYLPRSVLPFAALLGLMKRALSAARPARAQAAGCCGAGGVPSPPVRPASRRRPGWRPGPRRRRRAWLAGADLAGSRAAPAACAAPVDEFGAEHAAAPGPGRREASRYSSSRRSVSSRSPRTPAVLSATSRKRCARVSRALGQHQQRLAPGARSSSRTGSTSGCARRR